jgi:3-phosphoshikimate 1-carboxyvinyltransferase
VSASRATPPPVPDVVEVAPATRLAGSVRPPGDKSVSHRAVLLSALATGPSTIAGLSEGEDVARTVAAVGALGATVEPLDDGRLAVAGGPGRLAPADGALDCGNSGTTIRLLTGWLASVPGAHRLDGDGSLRRRPMDRVAVPLARMGIEVAGQGADANPPLEVRVGGVRATRYELPVPSAQVKSAVLLAGLAGDGPTTVVEPVHTRVYTEAMLASAHARVEVADRPDGRHTTVWPSTLTARDWTVPADPSQAAFLVVAAMLVADGEVRLGGIELSEERAGFLAVLDQMGGDVLQLDRRGDVADLVVTPRALRGAGAVAASRLPSLDEVPILAVAAAAAAGTTRFDGVGELRVKESDRLAGAAGLVNALGATATAVGDVLTVVGLGGASRFGRFEYDAAGDHRMAMAAAVAATVGSGGVIAGFSGVATSYPRFLADLASLR